MQAITVKSHTRRPSVQAELARKAMHNQLAREVGKPEPYPDLDIPFPPTNWPKAKDITIAFRDALVLVLFLAAAFGWLAVLA